MSRDHHARTAARILAYLRKQDTEAHPGGELRRKVFADVERYCIDFGMLSEDGWQQFDTEQDAPYFGVWTHCGMLEILTCCEGDWTLSTYAEPFEFGDAVREMRKFYGPRPAECRVIGADGQVREMSIREALGGEAGPAVVYTTDGGGDK